MNRGKEEVIAGLQCHEFQSGGQRRFDLLV